VREHACFGKSGGAGGKEKPEGIFIIHIDRIEATFASVLCQQPIVTVLILLRFAYGDHVSDRVSSMTAAVGVICIPIVIYNDRRPARRSKISDLRFCDAHVGGNPDSAQFEGCPAAFEQ